MNPMQRRARELLPQVLLTLLSIIQALALELLWSRLEESAYLWNGGLAAWAGWLQAVAVFQGILLVWLFYTSLVMRFSWLPSSRDSIFPFAIGVLEFSLVDLMGPEHPSLWLIAMALTFVVSSVASALTFERARLDPENEPYLSRVAPTGITSLVPTLAFAAAMVVVAGIVALVGGYGSVVLLAFAATNAALLTQTAIIRGYWRQSMNESVPVDTSSD